MTRAHRRYLAIEAAVAIAVNGLLSLAFVMAVFGGRVVVPVRALVLDAVPQSFMVGAMSCLVPTLLVRRRRAAGAIAGAPFRLGAPRSALGRALLAAAVATAVSVAAQAVLLPAITERWPFVAVLGFKCAYGALLGATVAVLSVRIALAERPS